MVRQLESVLLTLWLAKFHRTSLQWKRVRLGVPANPAEAKFFQVALRWADAIFIEDGFVNIVEAKLRPDLGALGQLEGYKDLFAVTPEFSRFVEWPIRMILLSPVLDVGIAEIAAKKNIIYEVFKPPEFN